MDLLRGVCKQCQGKAGESAEVKYNEFLAQQVGVFNELN